MFKNQVWQCGGSVEVLPCARIAHIERAHKPYTEDLTSHVRRNALRVAEVWMDEFKSHVYMAWNIPMEVSDHVDPVVQVQVTDHNILFTVSHKNRLQGKCIIFFVFFIYYKYVIVFVFI